MFKLVCIGVSPVTSGVLNVPLVAPIFLGVEIVSPLTPGVAIESLIAQLF